MGATKEQVGRDAQAWIERLIEVNETSLFTPSQRALIADRLKALRKELDGPIPFVEGHRR